MLDTGKFVVPPNLNAIRSAVTQQHPLLLKNIFVGSSNTPILTMTFPNQMPENILHAVCGILTQFGLQPDLRDQDDATTAIVANWLTNGGRENPYRFVEGALTEVNRYFHQITSATA